MNQRELQHRTKAFGVRITRLTEAIPKTLSGNTIAKQIIRSGTSIGANYRAACRAKSDRDFLNKMIIVEEEADETNYWMELLIEANLMQTDPLAPLLQEASELTAIFIAAGRTVRNRINNAVKSLPPNPKFEIRDPE